MIIKNKLKIVKVKDLFEQNLTIPDYQRPYKWSTKSVNRLFSDIDESFQQKKEHYRLGTIILHKDKNALEYNIVDGQQRVTTIALLLTLLTKKENEFIKNSMYSQLSKQSIINNYLLLENKVNNLFNKENYEKYLLENCEFVQIVTDDLSEAFQFFDSQNSRGKALEPHDNLKAYHLREMNNENSTLKIHLINAWESESVGELSNLFSRNLFPLINWYKSKGGLYYDNSKIDYFKGIKNQDVYNYSIYAKAANLFIEQMNSNGFSELTSSNELNQFQITQPIISGKRFFQYTLYYLQLRRKIKNIVSQKYSKELIPEERSGDKYIRELFFNVLIFFYDRFGENALDEKRLDFFYLWSYSLRLQRYSIYQESINKYAIKKLQNSELNMFAFINEIKNPNDIDEIILPKIESYDETVENRYKKIWEYFCKKMR